jgi:hypothetical protein
LGSVVMVGGLGWGDSWWAGVVRFFWGFHGCRRWVMVVGWMCNAYRGDGSRWMTIGVGIFLIVVGAVLAFAVKAHFR